MTDENLIYNPNSNGNFVLNFDGKIFLSGRLKKIVKAIAISEKNDIINGVYGM